MRPAPVILLVFSSISTIMGASDTHAKSNTCSLGELTRKITVVYSEPGQLVPCEVLYEKPNESEQHNQKMTLWRAQNEAGYCEAKASEFLRKLENLGWRCHTTLATSPQH